MPDLDKLERATFDALTAVGVWKDDGQIVMTEASKVSPEIENKDQTYRDWILAALKAGKLT